MFEMFLTGIFLNICVANAWHVFRKFTMLLIYNVEMQILPICTVHSSSVHNESFEIDHTELS